MIVTDPIASEGIEVRRAITIHGALEYKTDLFSEDELEPVEANIDREFREAVYRSQLAQRGLGLTRAQAAEPEQGELFDDEEDEPEEGPLN